MMRINPELPELMKQNNRQLFRELTDKVIASGCLEQKPRSARPESIQNHSRDDVIVSISLLMK